MNALSSSFWSSRFFCILEETHVKDGGNGAWYEWNMVSQPTDNLIKLPLRILNFNEGFKLVRAVIQTTHVFDHLTNKTLLSPWMIHIPCIQKKNWFVFHATILFFKERESSKTQAKRVQSTRGWERGGERSEPNEVPRQVSCFALAVQCFRDSIRPFSDWIKCKKTEGCEQSSLVRWKCEVRLAVMVLAERLV